MDAAIDNKMAGMPAEGVGRGVMGRAVGAGVDTGVISDGVALKNESIS